MRRFYLKDAAAGDIVEDVFVISNKQFSPTTTGKYFIKAFISDRTAQINARMWNATREIFTAMPESGFLKVRGRVENYQNNLQFIIEQMWPAKDGSFELDDLVPHTTKNIDQMCARLHDMIGSIQNRYVAAVLQTYLDNEELMGKFCKAPAAMNMHHAFIGGLLEHTLNAMEVADAVVKFYPGLNRDIVLAGIFVHDIAKTWELSYDCGFNYTDGGQLVGHIVKSAIWLDQHARKAEQMLGEKIPQNVIDVLEHIIISHHGTPEFGAVKPPSTPEAIAVHMIENMDAKLMMALTATRSQSSTAEGNWTEYMKAFSGRLYRPDVAPGDVGEGTTLEPDGEATAAAGSESTAAALPTLKLQINNPLFESTPSRKK